MNRWNRWVTWGAWAFALVLAGSAIPAFGEFYKYIDSDGQVRFTDNLANVPAGQRSQVEEYRPLPELPDPGPAPEKVPEQAEDTQETPQKEEGEEKSASPAAADKVDMAQVLEEEGEKLKEEYDALMEERAQLDRMASRRLTPAARRDLLDGIKDFNTRIADYEKRREAHNRAVADYDASTSQIEIVTPGAEGR